MIFLLYALYFNNAFSTVGKKATFKITNGAETNTLVFKGVGDKALIEIEDSNRYLLVIDLKDRKDKRTLYLVDRDDKYYIPLSYKDIQSLIAIKKIFGGNKPKKNIDIFTKNEVVSRAGFRSFVFSAEYYDTPVEIEFSKQAEELISKSIAYREMIEFISSIDFSILGLGNATFDIIESFLNYSLKHGLITKLNVFDIDILTLEKIEDVEVDQSIFEIDEKKYEKANLDKIISLI